MDSELEEAVCKLAWLNFACARGDLHSGAALLAELKVLLTRLPSLPPSFEKTPNAVEELKIARAIYENAVILILKIKDREAFERSLCQLKEFYINTWLLAENRIAEFHTELELLPLEALSHPCIKYAVELEQSFMEGAYNRLINARQAVPHETYVYLMDLLAETVRDEVADCSVEAYDYLPINVAKKMLMFTSDQELLEYIWEEQPEWEIKDCSVHFDMAKPKSHMDLPSFKLIKQALSYARELENIV
ncbi:hypothetical protein PVAP13_7NG405600 [Panicum virgatum]|uniref:CSN8/PSMD8/EIF3K domain-containing protein n=1 Tax=Panicum virgatum TaxID=38727 RepID=A0A8T0Q3H1_PANVG|nr:hypothetical protein PVAP13_7NG405600 [Panicum virgatum]